MEGSGQVSGMLRACRPGPRGFSGRYAARIGYQIRERTSGLARLTLLPGRALRRIGLGLRLSSKIFLASALVILVFAGVSVLSLGAVGRLVSVNREISVSSIPALTITASARDALPRLLALETRALVLGDPRYATA